MASASPSLRGYLLFAVPAFVGSLVLLSYAWGRGLVMAMRSEFRPELKSAILLVAGIALCGILSRWAALRAPSPRLHRWVCVALLVGWLIGNGVLVWMVSGDSHPLLVLIPTFALSGLWVLWLAWFFAWPLPLPGRIGLLFLTLIPTPVFILLFDVTVMGSAMPTFVWRAASVHHLSNSDADDIKGEADIVVSESDSPHLLGPERLGVYPNVALKSDWKDHPPREVWRKQVGGGWGGIAVVGDYVFTQEQRDKKECVCCYRLSDGELVWRRTNVARFSSWMGSNGPRGTPTVADGKVYTVGATGFLNCLDARNGQRLWSKDILKDNDADNIEHGVTGSPLVLDNLVIVCPTGSGGPSLVAYHKDNGERIWRGGTDQSSYSSPIVADLGGRRQILFFTRVNVGGYEPKTGELLWTYPWINAQKINCSQPIPNAGGSGQVFIASGYGKGCALLRVEEKDGKWNANALWESKEMKTKFTSAVLHDGHIYGLDDGILECIDLTDGKKVWKGGRYGHGQLLLAGDLLVVQTEPGPVCLVSASPKGFRELGKIPALSEKTWNIPTLAGKYLLVRNDVEAVCYEPASDQR